MTDQSHPMLHLVPIGINATGERHETDSMGEDRVRIRRDGKV
jgi:hypothetical protein